ncbi:MFS transporter [Micromonospora endolithica]|uniref:DHA2 family efflux MFS transporter permease subunit n=1 Tax=Micromonospora endolithica TaxID=230091 RepID=A0A3A9YWA0_9ACTN|nr:MFS transporter [Micromonospora endolithica]RKN40298.1 DHA2 family efflux MFS transporter permease subunit [Micromonospora endolithica]TWJ22621.1 EmrB/QacA subfamily drug resistance transporter [Micromonospora endolithica]
MQPHENTGHPRRWAILGVLVISLLVVVLDNTILNVALRTLADPVHGLGATQGELEWSINSYTLVFAGLLFTFGVLGDRAGRKRFLLIGLALFGLASLLSAYAQSPAQLIAARALMGVGGAAIMPVTLSIISNVFDPRERGRAIGVWAGAVGLAVAIGPVLGGALLETFWWGSVFLINVPVVLAGLVLVTLLVPESRDPQPGRVDVPGVVLSVVGLVALSYGIIDGGEHGFGRPVVWAAIVGGVAVLAWFVVHERRSDHPSLDVRLFRVPRFAAPVAMIGLVFFAAMGVMFFSSFYLQLVRGYSPLETGLLFLPFAVAQLAFAPRSAAMVQRYGGKAVSAVGLALTTAALAVFAVVDERTAIWVVLVAFFVQGVGMANIMPPAMESIMSAVPREKAGVGSAVSNTVRQVAGALGVAVLGSVLAASYRADVGPALRDLPAGAREAAGESVSGAYAAAGQLGPAGPQLIAVANDAFVSAMHTAAVVAAVVAGLGILVVLRWMPGRTPTPAAVAPAAEPELAGTA